MLGQNMFPRAPPSGQTSIPEKQSQQNKQKFDQLIQLMQDQQQRVENYNISMKQREDQLQQLELNSQQLQKDLVQGDKIRKQHNTILYKNYQPGFNVKQEEPPQEAEAAQSLHSSKYQLYNQGIQPEELEQIQMSQNPRRNSMQQSKQEPRPQSNQKNPKLLSIQKQIEEQNEYIQQLTSLISKKPNSAQQTTDSLEALLNEREELKKQQLLNEVQQLKEKLSGLQNRQPQINPYAQMMQPPGFQMQQQYPYQYPPMMPPPPQAQTQEEESDEDDLTKQLMMKLMMQQEPRKQGHRKREVRKRKHKKREPQESDPDELDPQ